MLVQVIMEFILKAQSVKLLHKRDVVVINSLSDSLRQFDPKDTLSDEKIEQVKTIVLDRFSQIVDKNDDLTFRPNCEINKLFITLLQQISIEQNIPLVRLLFPMIKHHYDLILCHPITFKEPERCLAWLILSEDNTHLIDIRSLISHVNSKISTRAIDSNDFSFFQKNNRIFATYMTIDSLALCVFSIHEFLRIRRKSLNKKINNSLTKQTTGENAKYANIWVYFERRIIPQWAAKGRLLLHLVRPLLEIIDSYYAQKQKTHDKGSFRKQLLLWFKILRTSSVDNIDYIICINHLYAQNIWVGKEKKYLINVLLDCFEKEHNALDDHIQGLARFLNNCNASYISKRDEFLNLYTELEVNDVFTLDKLNEYLVRFSLNCPVQLKQSINSVLEFLKEKVEIDVFVLEKLEQFYSQYAQEVKKNSMSSHWVRLTQRLDPILIKMNYHALLRPVPEIPFGVLNKIRLQHGSVYYVWFDKTYEHFPGFLTHYAAPKWAQFDEIPRHILPLLLELVDVYFEQPIDSFRRKLKAWVKDLQDQSICAVNDMHYLFRQSIEIPLIYSNKKSPQDIEPRENLYFLDVLLILLYDNNAIQMDHAIVALATWLCNYDKSYIAKHARFNSIYQAVCLGSYLDKTQLSQMVACLIKEVVSPVDISRLDRLVRLINQTGSIDQKIIHTIQMIYKNRDLSTLTPRWIDVIAALSGARLIPSNYYVWLGMNEFDTVKLVPTIDYPLSHYIASEDGFVLLDNIKDYYQYQKQKDESCIESSWLYDCSQLNPKPLTGDERCQLLSSHKKFHKYFYLTNPFQSDDEAICLATLDALIRLVNSSLYIIGTRFTGQYSKQQNTEAEDAYRLFSEFYHAMDVDERTRLNNQIIFFEGQYKSFKKVLSEVYDYKCIANSGQFILKLIVDYLPDKKFDDHIEKKQTFNLLGGSVSASIAIQEMRSNSQHKIPRDNPVAQDGSIDSTPPSASATKDTSGFFIFNFFIFNNNEASTPATKPQKAAPTPKKDKPDEETKSVMILGSR